MKKKILLVHGWNYNNYTNMTAETDAWHNRKNFVSALEQKYEVYKLNLPGFCGEAEPINSSGWKLDDFAKYINNHLTKNKLNVDYILGYSFGGPVLVRWKTMFSQNTKLILVSPAIIRSSNNSKTFIQTPRLLTPIRNYLRNQYIIHIVKTKEMVHGTKFLCNTYQIIARDDLRLELQTIDPNDISLVLGDKDTQISPQKLYDSLDDNFKSTVHFINGGGHDIATTHTEKVVKVIDSITK